MSNLECPVIWFCPCVYAGQLYRRAAEHGLRLTFINGVVAPGTPEEVGDRVVR